MCPICQNNTRQLQQLREAQLLLLKSAQLIKQHFQYMTLSTLKKKKKKCMKAILLFILKVVTTSQYPLNVSFFPCILQRWFQSVTNFFPSLSWQQYSWKYLFYLRAIIHRTQREYACWEGIKMEREKLKKMTVVLWTGR